MDARGGIARVSATYARAGLFRETAGGFRARYFPSTIDGSRLVRLVYGGYRLLIFALTPLTPGTIVHLHTTWRASFWRKATYAWLARLRRAIVVHHIHAFGLLDTVRSGHVLARTAVSRALRRADALIVLTPAMASRVREDFPGVPIYVIPNPVDIDAEAPTSPTVREESLLAFLGWFTPEKGTFDLLDAIGLLRSRGRRIGALLAGSHNEAALRRGIEARGLGDQVVVAGWLDRNEVSRLLRRCTILVLPSHQEGFGLVLVEAMACGAPIVTCPVGGVMDVVQQGRNADFARAKDPVDLADTIDRLLSDPARRAAMSAVGPGDAGRFRTREVLDLLRHTYAACVESRADAGKEE